jgi:lactate dehydrogenase-like 2-hydroxyacid dehydrogenase
MLILEEYTYNRARTVFDESGLVKEVVSGPGWPRMLKANLEEGINSFIISHERFPDDEFYRKLKRGTLLVRLGVGYDSVPVILCRDLGLLVANTPGTLDQSVAEHAMTLISSLARLVIIQDSDLKAGRWSPVMAEELSGKKLAIIGFGSIGRSLARIAKLGYGMKVTAFDVNEKIREIHSELFDFFTTRFEEAVRDADYVSIHMNLNASTVNFINRERLKCFKRGAAIVNTSRGGVIDEDDLYEALTDGTLSSAGLDVFVNEPYFPSGKYDIRKLPNVVLSPHVASHTPAANRRMGESALRSVKLHEEGRLGEIPIVPELRT